MLALGVRRLMFSPTDVACTSAATSYLDPTVASTALIKHAMSKKTIELFSTETDVDQWLFPAMPTPRIASPVGRS